MKILLKNCFFSLHGVRGRGKGEEGGKKKGQRHQRLFCAYDLANRKSEMKEGGEKERGRKRRVIFTTSGFPLPLLLGTSRYPSPAGRAQAGKRGNTAEGKKRGEKGE